MQIEKSKNWFIQVKNELDRAEQARAEGNEGMARVCARRGVGIALGEYFNQRGIRNFGTSVVERIIIFISMPNTSSQAVEIANHFQIRVNEDFKLPIDVDLIEETHWLVNYIHQRLETE